MPERRSYLSENSGRVNLTTRAPNLNLGPNPAQGLISAGNSLQRTGLSLLSFASGKERESRGNALAEAKRISDKFAANLTNKVKAREEQAKHATNLQSTDMERRFLSVKTQLELEWAQLQPTLSVHEQANAWAELVEKHTPNLQTELDASIAKYPNTTYDKGLDPWLLKFQEAAADVAVGLVAESAVQKQVEALDNAVAISTSAVQNIRHSNPVNVVEIASKELVSAAEILPRSQLSKYVDEMQEVTGAELEALEDRAPGTLSHELVQSAFEAGVLSIQERRRLNKIVDDAPKVIERSLNERVTQVADRLRMGEEIGEPELTELSKIIGHNNADNPVRAQALYSKLAAAQITGSFAQKRNNGELVTDYHAASQIARGDMDPMEGVDLSKLEVNDRKQITNEVTQLFKQEMEMIRSGQANIVFGRSLDIQTAVKNGKDPVQLASVYDKLYDEAKVPEMYRNHAHPVMSQPILEALKTDDANNIEKEITNLLQFRGRSLVRDALKSVVHNEEVPDRWAGAMAYLAETADSVPAGRLPELVPAIVANASDNVDAAATALRDNYKSEVAALLSTLSLGVSDPGDLIADVAAGKPIDAGSDQSIRNIVLAMQQTHGSRHAEAFSAFANQWVAARAVRYHSGAREPFAKAAIDFQTMVANTLMVVRTTGANNPNPNYTMVPVTGRASQLFEFIKGERSGVGSTQELAEQQADALDSIAQYQDLDLNTFDEIFTEFPDMLQQNFSVLPGFWTRELMPNLSTAYWDPGTEPPAAIAHIDPGSMQLADGTKLGDPDVFPDVPAYTMKDLRERMRPKTTDPSTRAALLMGQKGQWVYNSRTNAYDLYIRPGRARPGPSGEAITAGDPQRVYNTRGEGVSIGMGAVNDVAANTLRFGPGMERAERVMRNNPAWSLMRWAWKELSEK